MIAIGTDIVDIRRIESSLQRQGDAFVERILTVAEILEFERFKRRPAYLAKRFAAKEAVAKALGTGIGYGVSFQNIEISNNTMGAPQVALNGGAEEKLQELGASSVRLSLSDERNYAVAFAVLL